MARHSLSRTLPILVIATATAGLTAPQGAAQTTTPCPNPGNLEFRSLPQRVDVLGCGLVGEVVIASNSLGLSIPSPAQSAGAEALATDGAYTATVTVDASGHMTFEESHESSTIRTSTPSTGPSACSDSAYKVHDAEQAGVWYWWLGDGARPAGLTTSETAAAMDQTLDWLSTGYNDCGMSAGYSVYEVASNYQGVTSYESDMHMNSDGVHVCGDESANNRDGTDTVDFGNLNEDYSSRIAVTCWWTLGQPFNANNILEADVRFNVEDHDFYYTKPSACAGIYDLRGVAMHEFGHVYGLDHVSEDNHGELTMSTNIDPCDNAVRTLGKGDIYSMREHY